MAEEDFTFPVIGAERIQSNSDPFLPSTGIPSYDYLQGAFNSAVSGVTELIGIELPGAAEWRTEHPLMGLATQLAGAAIPYGGWYGATAKIPRFMRALDKIGDLNKAPFLAGAGREAARLAPFEAGRLGVSQIFGDESFSTMAGDVALSLGLGAGIGGLVHGIAAAGTRGAAQRTSIPGVDASAPIPLQLRKMKELVAGNALTPEQIAAANHRINEFETLARAERPPQGQKYLGDLGGPGITRGVESLFNLSANPGTVVTRRPFIARGAKGKPGFESEEAWKAAAVEAGLPEDFSSQGRYFRHISFKPTGRTDVVAKQVGDLFSDLQSGKMTSESYQAAVERLASKDYSRKRASAIDRQLTTGLDSIGENTFMKRETNGLFVMAKKVKGTPGKGSSDDAWVVFKTDKPGYFVPGAQKWADTVLEANSWHIGAAVPKDAGRVHNTVAAAMKHFPMQNIEVLSRPGVIERIMPQKLKGTSNEFAHRLKEEVREYLAPTAHQFTKNPLARFIHSNAKLATETADTIAHEVVYGRQAAPKGNLFSYALRQGAVEPNEDSFKAILDPLSDADLEHLRYLRNKEIPPKEYDALAKAGIITESAANAAHRLEQLADFTWEEQTKLARAMGETPKKPRKGHLGISNWWEGDTRIAIRSESGDILGFGAGKTRKAAQANAKKLTEILPGSRLGEEFSISQMESLPKEFQIAVGTPGFLQERRGLRGFKWDLEPWTKQELLEAYGESQAVRFRYQAEKTIENLLSQPLAQLAATDPAAHRMVTARINDLLLKQSKGSDWQNRVADTALAPMVGPNSATKIASLTNTGMYTWHLGMGNIAHPALNLLTFVQTVLPEAAMLLNTAPTNPNYYSYMLAGGSKGPKGVLSVLSPLKVTLQSFKEMAKPRAQTLKAIQRAANEGVVAPRLVEEFVGEQAVKIGDLRSAFGSGKGFAQWLFALSNWLPANSEKLSRIHAFTTGYVIAKDVLGVASEESAYQLAKKFTEKTMFLYSQADRPRIFTTPAGSAMGLFKTWMMNYIANMMEYSGQALKGNIAPLAWQTAGTAALGGLAATPLYWVANGFSRAFDGDPLLINTYENLSEGSADALMFGLPAALSGVSLYSQVSSPLADPIRDANMLWSSVTLDRMLALSKGVGSAIDHWQATGEHPGRSPVIQNQLVKALAPSTIARTIAAFSGEDSILSLSTSYPLVEDMSLGERMLYAMKFTPTQVDKAMAVSNELYRDKAQRIERVQSLGQAFAEAALAGDSKAQSNIINQAVFWGIGVDSVLRSAINRMERFSQTNIESSFKPADVAPYEEILR